MAIDELLPFGHRHRRMRGFGTFSKHVDQRIKQPRRFHRLRYRRGDRTRSRGVISSKNPDSMTPAERQAESASILARGVVRAVRATRARTGGTETLLMLPIVFSTTSKNTREWGAHDKRQAYWQLRITLRQS